MDKKRCLLHSAAIRRSIRPLQPFAADLEQAIDELTAGLGHAPTETEIAGWLHTELSDSGRMLLQFQDPAARTACPIGTEEPGEEELIDLPNPGSNPTLSRAPLARKAPVHLFPVATSRPIVAAANLLAPDIEEAIQLLTVKLDRSPTEVEIAAELNITLPGYQHILGCLKDLEIGTFFLEGRREDGEEELSYLPNGTDEDPLLRCLRSEMQSILRDAIEMLPFPEQLVLTFYYSEELGSREISVSLSLPESTISRMLASASLSIRATLASITINGNWDARTRPEDGMSHGSSLQIGDAAETELEEVQVVVSGHHVVSVPTAPSSRRLLGSRQDWFRNFRSWYAIKEQQRITQVRRQERHTRESGY